MQDTPPSQLELRTRRARPLGAVVGAVGAEAGIFSMTSPPDVVESVCSEGRGKRTAGRSVGQNACVSQWFQHNTAASNRTIDPPPFLSKQRAVKHVMNEFNGKGSGYILLSCVRRRILARNGK